MMSRESENEKTRVIKSREIKSAAGDEKSATRIYDVPAKETLIVSKHKWISDEDEDIIKPVGRSTIVRGRTQIYGQPLSETRVYEKPQTKEPADDTAGRTGRDMKEVFTDAAARARRIYEDLRNVRVRDSARFGRFLKVVGVFALILLLEAGYFAFAHRTRELPDDITKARHELELTQKETAILQNEIDELGSYDSIEEQRRSWERLKEKVEKAAAETSY